MDAPGCGGWSGRRRNRPDEPSGLRRSPGPTSDQVGPVAGAASLRLHPSGPVRDRWRHEHLAGRTSPRRPGWLPESSGHRPLGSHRDETATASHPHRVAVVNRKASPRSLALTGELGFQNENPACWECSRSGSHRCHGAPKDWRSAGLAIPGRRWSGALVTAIVLVDRSRACDARRAGHRTSAVPSGACRSDRPRRGAWPLRAASARSRGPWGCRRPRCPCRPCRSRGLGPTDSRSPGRPVRPRPGYRRNGDPRSRRYPTAVPVHEPLATSRRACGPGDHRPDLARACGPGHPEAQPLPAGDRCRLRRPKGSRRSGSACRPASHSGMRHPPRPSMFRFLADGRTSIRPGDSDRRSGLGRTGLRGAIAVPDPDRTPRAVNRRRPARSSQRAWTHAPPAASGQTAGRSRMRAHCDSDRPGPVRGSPARSPTRRNSTDHRAADRRSAGRLRSGAGADPLARNETGCGRWDRCPARPDRPGTADRPGNVAAGCWHRRPDGARWCWPSEYYPGCSGADPRLAGRVDPADSGRPRSGCRAEIGHSVELGLAAAGLAAGLGPDCGGCFARDSGRGAGSGSVAAGSGSGPEAGDCSGRGRCEAGRASRDPCRRASAVAAALAVHHAGRCEAPGSPAEAGEPDSELDPSIRAASDPRRAGAGQAGAGREQGGAGERPGWEDSGGRPPASSAAPREVSQLPPGAEGR